MNFDMDCFDYFGINDKNPDLKKLADGFIRFFKETGAEICGRKGFRFSEIYPDDSFITEWAENLAGDDFQRGNTLEDLYDEVDDFVHREGGDDTLRIIIDGLAHLAQGDEYLHSIIVQVGTGFQ